MWLQRGAVVMPKGVRGESSITIIQDVSSSSFLIFLIF